ncbi:DNA pilot protein [Apis mellifera associated microvirus 43]|nr:DNA pilot protein [Apis mellifera associated microvirus 43]
MVLPLIAAGISAGTQLLGAKMASDSSAKAQRLAQIQAYQQEQTQREFAQSGIQWRVQDAKKAGIHPLYALGANTPTYTPVSSTFSGDASMGNAVANMGQDISRAMMSTQSESTKLTAFQQTAQRLSLEKMALENQLLGSQIAKLNASQSPPMPLGDKRLIAGQGNSSLVENVPLERVTPAPGSPNMEPDYVTDMGFTRTNNGRFPVMSKDAKERMEEDFLGGLAWNLRNRVLPTIGLNQTPPTEDAGKGYMWFYNPLRQQYERKVDTRGRGIVRDIYRYLTR